MPPFLESFCYCSIYSYRGLKFLVSAGSGFRAVPRLEELLTNRECRSLLTKRESSAGFIINHPAPLSLAGLVGLLLCDLNIGPSVMVGEEKRDSRTKAARQSLL